MNSRRPTFPLCSFAIRSAMLSRAIGSMPPFIPCGSAVGACHAGRRCPSYQRASYVRVESGEAVCRPRLRVRKPTEEAAAVRQPVAIEVDAEFWRGRIPEPADCVKSWAFRCEFGHAHFETHIKCGCRSTIHTSSLIQPRIQTFTPPTQ